MVRGKLKVAAGIISGVFVVVTIAVGGTKVLEQAQTKTKYILKGFKYVKQNQQKKF